GIDKILINVAYSSQSIEKDQKEDGNGSEDHLHLYIDAEPQNEERSKSDFWDAVNCCDKRVKKLRQRLLNPQEETNQNTTGNTRNETKQCLLERNRCMEPERSITNPGHELLCNSQRTTDEQRIDKSTRDKLPHQ